MIKVCIIQETIHKTTQQTIHKLTRIIKTIQIIKFHFNNIKAHLLTKNKQKIPWKIDKALLGS